MRDVLRMQHAWGQQEGWFGGSRRQAGWGRGRCHAVLRAFLHEGLPELRVGLAGAGCRGRLAAAAAVDDADEDAA